MNKPYGVDVSHHQNPAKLPWATFAESSSFAIVRGSYGTMKDRVTAEHVKRARAFGLKTGLYHFFRPTQPVRAQLEVFRAQLERALPGDIVPTIDIEADPLPKPGQHVTPAWQGSVLEFVDAIVSEFGDCMVYITQREFGMLGAPAWLLSRPLWVAHYHAGPKPATPANRPATIWQHRVGPYDPKGPGGYIKDRPELDQNRLLGALPLIGVLASTPLPDPLPQRPTENDDDLEEQIAASNFAVLDAFTTAEWERHIGDPSRVGGRALLEHERASEAESDDDGEPRS